MQGWSPRGHRPSDRKNKIAVSLERIGAMPRVPFADRSCICILDAGDGEANVQLRLPTDGPEGAMARRRAKTGTS